MHTPAFSGYTWHVSQHSQRKPASILPKHFRRIQKTYFIHLYTNRSLLCLLLIFKGCPGFIDTQISKPFPTFISKRLSFWRPSLGESRWNRATYFEPKSLGSMASAKQSWGGSMGWIRGCVILDTVAFQIENLRMRWQHFNGFYRWSLLSMLRTCVIYMK